MNKLTSNNLDEPIATHASTNYTVLQIGQTVEQALASLRTGTVAEKVVYFYVIDAERRLVGVVPTRRLLMADPRTPVGDIMVSRVISIPQSASVLDACEFFVMHRLLAFPIVDSENRLMGVVDVSLFTDEMFDVSERQAAQDAFQLMGMQVARMRQASPWAGFRNRFPWLLCNIGGGLACAFLLGFYESLLDQVITLAMFIPVVLALAESVSMQSMTITLQALHESNVDWRRLRRALGREFLTALLLGLACGALVGVVSLLWKHRPAVAIAIGASIGFSILTASILGVLLPALLRAFRGDPRIAAGPIVLASADLLTLLFYFNLAQSILR